MKKNTLIAMAIFVAGSLLIVHLSRPRTFGVLKVSAKQGSLTLATGFHKITVQGGGDAEVRVPTGTYRSLSLLLKNGSYTLGSHGPWGNIATVQVRKDRVTNLEFGPPLHVKAMAHPDHGVVDFDVSILGRGGEEYEKAVRIDGTNLAAPKIKIVDEKGQVLSEGEFEFG